MDENARIIIGIRLEKARQELKAARQLIDSAMYRFWDNHSRFADQGH